MDLRKSMREVADAVIEQSKGEGKGRPLKR
jgi:hypothetical protein